MEKGSEGGIVGKFRVLNASKVPLLEIHSTHSLPKHSEKFYHQEVYLDLFTLVFFQIYLTIDVPLPPTNTCYNPGE